MFLRVKRTLWINIIKMFSPRCLRKSCISKRTSKTYGPSSIFYICIILHKEMMILSFQTHGGISTSLYSLMYIYISGIFFV